MILVYLGRWSYGRFQDDNNIFFKMKNDLTTGTWQDDIWCPIIIILFCTSAVPPMDGVDMGTSEQIGSLVQPTRRMLLVLHAQISWHCRMKEFRGQILAPKEKRGGRPVTMIQHHLEKTAILPIFTTCISPTSLLPNQRIFLIHRWLQSFWGGQPRQQISERIPVERGVENIRTSCHLNYRKFTRWLVSHLPMGWLPSPSSTTGSACKMKSHYLGATWSARRLIWRTWWWGRL